MCKCQIAFKLQTNVTDIKFENLNAQMVNCVHVNHIAPQITASNYSRLWKRDRHSNVSDCFSVDKQSYHFQLFNIKLHDMSRITFNGFHWKQTVYELAENLSLLAIIWISIQLNVNHSKRFFFSRRSPCIVHIHDCPSANAFLFHRFWLSFLRNDAMQYIYVGI